MIYRSRAPFRIGLAGGGTDVSPYSDEYGGAILNATINLFAYTALIPRADSQVIIRDPQRGIELRYEAQDELPIDGTLDLQKGVYNRVIRDYCDAPMGLEMITSMDVSSGSGLGTSSTLVVSILGAFVEMLKLPLGEYDIAHLAYCIEREDLRMAGGKQDQYAATFGGVNFMEFEGEKVIVNPLRIRTDALNELAFNTVLYYTQTSRESARIIENQMKNVSQHAEKPIHAMHQVKQQAFAMKEALLKNDLNKIGEILHVSWLHKKEMAEGITNPMIEDLYETAVRAGASGGKISGAGGGGFMVFYAPNNRRYEVAQALESKGGNVFRYQFSPAGLTRWTLKSTSL